MIQTSGAIAISDICVELGLDSSTNISLNDGRCRKLCKKEAINTAIGMSDFYGKSNFEYEVVASSRNISNWRGPAADGGTYWSNGGGWIITVNTPSTITIKEVQIYNEDGSLGKLLPVGTAIPATEGTTASVVIPKAFRLSTQTGNQVELIGTGMRRNGSSNRWYLTLPKLAVIDTNGNSYELLNSPNLQLWYQIYGR